MKSLIEFLRKIFRIGIIGNIIATITLFVTFLFGYTQYQRIVYQEVKPITLGIIEDKKTHTTIIARTNDSIKLLYPALCPSYKNTSKYAINNLFLEITVITPLLPKYYYKQNEEFKEYGQRIIGNMLHTTFTYKTETLFPFETTPPFIREIVMLPEEDKESLFFRFQINTKVMWDGKTPQEYTTYVSCLHVEDNYQQVRPLNFQNKEDSLNYINWVNKVVCSLKGRLSSYNNDLIIAYHTYVDSIANPSNNRGALITFHEISNDNIEGIAHVTRDFLEKHDYSFDKPKLIIKYSIVDVIVGFLFLITSLILIANVIKIYKSSNSKVKFLVVLGIPVLLCFTYLLLRKWLLYKQYISVHFYNNSWELTGIGFLLCSIISFYVLYELLKIVIQGIKRRYGRKYFFEQNSDELFIFFFVLIWLLAFTYSFWEATNNIVDYPFVEY